MAGSLCSATSDSTVWQPLGRCVASCARWSAMGAAKKVTPRFTMPGACASLSAKFSAFSKSSKVTSVSSHGCAGASAISSSSTRPLVPHR
ncbi:hypothetical protein D9M69_551140 [compost metagenome]